LRRRGSRPDQRPAGALAVQLHAESLLRVNVEERVRQTLFNSWTSWPCGRTPRRFA